MTPAPKKRKPKRSAKNATIKCSCVGCREARLILSPVHHYPDGLRAWATHLVRLRGTVRDAETRGMRCVFHDGFHFAVMHLCPTHSMSDPATVYDAIDVLHELQRVGK